jgi:hypothetical protein
MNPTEPIRPLEEGVDPSNEEIVRERLKTADQEKSSPWSEAKRRIISQPVLGERPSHRIR